MNLITNYLFVCLLLTGYQPPAFGSNPVNIYPNLNERTVSEENKTYYIDPVNGSDVNTGTRKNAPWKTFQQLNRLQLTKGNKVEIVSPGTFRESLYLTGQGTADAPIIIEFAGGEYDFYPEKAFKSTFHISNTNDAPDSLKAVAFYFLKCNYVQVKGNGAAIIFRGKVIETSLDSCNNLSIQDLRFDYKRPTVSEMKVLKVGDHFADVDIHKDSKYEIKDSSLTWIGEGWQYKVQNYWQEFNPLSQTVVRKSMAFDKIKFSATGTNQVRIYFDKNPGLVQGLIYQNRNTIRDYAAVFMQRSKNISWKNINVYFLHGMGFVSQFCENISFDSLVVKPKANSGRTCTAWADILHFSGCKGKIMIENSFLSAANDDAVNVHGTHLRITGMPSQKKIRVRFMHPQTFGFDAFYAGDSIEFIHVKSLLPYAKNKISAVQQLSDKEFELTLSQIVPGNIQPDDVIENITWTPDVTIRNTEIVYIPTRGILVTTRGKVIIENNKFIKTGMNGILIADDAAGWYESGYVRDVTIRNNKFVECGAPVIDIHPENSAIDELTPVHKNILVKNNQFVVAGKATIFSAKSTGNIRFADNAIEADKTPDINDLFSLKACPAVDIKNNKLNNTPLNNIIRE